MMRATLAAVLVVTVLQIPGGARQDQSDLISKDLVERLFGGEMKIVEGAPPDFPRELIPDGATARISMSNATMATVVAEAPAFTRADGPRYERKMAAAGWRQMEGPRGMRGLSMNSMPAPTMFCREGHQLSYSTVPRREGGSWVHVSMTSFGGQTSCDQIAAGASGPMRSIFDDERMPALTPPEDGRVVSMHSGGGDDYEEQQIRLVTRMSLPEIAKHYTALVTSHGWKTDAEASVEGITIARFSAPLGEAGALVPAIVSAMSLPDGGVAVTLRVLMAPSWRR